MRKPQSTMVLLLLVGALTALRAEQFVFINKTVHWNKTNYDLPTQQGPANWVTPINYVDGRVYAKYEVLEKPSDLPVAVQLCMWQDGFTKESCANCYVYENPGVYYIDWAIPSGWWVMAPLDYTRTFQQIYLMHKPHACHKNLLMINACGSHCYGPDYVEEYGPIDDHVPITFKVTVIVVAKGSKLVPPSDWGDNPWVAPTDKTPPQVSSIKSSEQGKIVVKFSEAVGRANAESRWSYKIAPETGVLSVALQPDGKTVELTVSNALHPDTAYFLSVKDVVDLSGNKISYSAKSFRYTGPVGIASHPAFLRNHVPHIELLPGPIQGSIRISLDGAPVGHSNVRLDVYDVTGARVDRLTVQPGKTGLWSPPDRRSGVWLMMIRSQGMHIAKRVVTTR